MEKWKRSKNKKRFPPYRSGIMGNCAENLLQFCSFFRQFEPLMWRIALAATRNMAVADLDVAAAAAGHVAQSVVEETEALKELMHRRVYPLVNRCPAACYSQVHFFAWMKWQSGSWAS